MFPLCASPLRCFSQFFHDPVFPHLLLFFGRGESRRHQQPEPHPRQRFEIPYAPGENQHFQIAHLPDPAPIAADAHAGEIEFGDRQVELPSHAIMKLYHKRVMFPL